MLKGWEEDKTNTKTAEETLDSYIKSYNDSIAKHTEKMHFGLHICRGMFTCLSGLNKKLTVSRELHGFPPFQ
jgi:methionine synthase II (cobalamin-independent)